MARFADFALGGTLARPFGGCEMKDGEKRVLWFGVTAGTILGLAIGLMIALFVAMKPGVFAGLIH
jgi:hypothetical protein